MPMNRSFQHALIVFLLSAQSLYAAKLTSSTNEVRRPQKEQSELLSVSAITKSSKVTLGKKTSDGASKVASEKEAAQMGADVLLNGFGEKKDKAILTDGDLAEIADIAGQKGSAATSSGSTDSNVQEFVTPSTEYELELDNHLNVQYSGLFTIGMQELQAIYDTGSFEVLALSTRCTKCVRTLEMYNDKASDSFRESPREVIAEHEFVSGSVTTAEGFETLRLGRKDSPVIANDMTFWMVQKHELKFWKTGNAIFSAIVGLSHVKSIPEGFGGDMRETRSMLEEMHLDAFALCYRRGGGQYRPGLLKYGPTVSGMAHDPGFQSVDVSGDSHWATKLSQFKVDLDGIDTSSMCKPSCGALIDSGTSLLTFPRSASHLTQALKDKVRSDCSNLDELPTLYFELDGAEVVLPPRAYIFQVESGGELKCKGAFMKVDKESQFGEVFILGMPFLRYYFTIFDREQKQVHIAPATEDCQVAKPSMMLLSTNTSSASGNKAASRLHAGLTQEDFTEATMANLDDAIMPGWINAPGDKIRL
eukprot:TRINITY_DN12391_c0_g2_i1.p1 TRINITY_DN12391_c0_g2~~TRINITY_DN12391_c0_g2_i1.p1  ORF type:complete len:533 (+),score=126.29 TRINITY_DN12391_c0_g2_i1:68-1666(+)